MLCKPIPTKVKTGLAGIRGNSVRPPNGAPEKGPICVGSASAFATGGLSHFLLAAQREIFLKLRRIIGATLMPRLL